jgi:DNA-directed RNA polymerase subunit RPC12/RpoP
VKPLGFAVWSALGRRITTDTSKAVGHHLAVSPHMRDYTTDDLLSVNCGTCGKSLIVRIEDIRHLRTIDCEACGKTLPMREGTTRSLPILSVEPHSHSAPKRARGVRS